MSGYSKNLVTLERMLPFLGPIIQGELCAWNTPAGEADKFAYKVREALYLAILHRPKFAAWSLQTPHGDSKYEDMEKVARMAGKLRIVVMGPSLVEARLAKGSTEAEVLVRSQAPMNGYEDAGKSVVTVGRQTVASIKAAWTAAQPSNTPMNFPSAHLSYEELVELHGWVSEMHMIMFEIDGSLTIQHRSKDLESFAWAPRETQQHDVPEYDFPFND